MGIWLSENAGTIVIALLLLGIVAAAVTVLRRDRKNGKCSCGNSCGHCPMNGCCHKDK